MTNREQIYKAALEEIAKPKVGYDQHLYCDTCLRWTELCCNPCPGYKARAALEAAAKVGDAPPANCDHKGWGLVNRRCTGCNGRVI